MRVLRSCIIVLALGPGLFMTFDGLRATGVAYLRDGVGRAVGIAPRSSTMKILFVMSGVTWLGATAGFLRRTPWSARALAVLAVATLWYLPVGTLMSTLVLIGLALLRRQSNKSLQN